MFRFNKHFCQIADQALNIYVITYEKKTPLVRKRFGPVGTWHKTCVGPLGIRFSECVTDL